MGLNLGSILRFGADALSRGKQKNPGFMMGPTNTFGGGDFSGGALGGGIRHPGAPTMMPFPGITDPIDTFNNPGGEVRSGLGSTLRNIGGWAADHPDTILKGAGLLMQYKGARDQGKREDEILDMQRQDRDEEREARRRRAEAINALLPQIMSGYSR